MPKVEVTGSSIRRVAKEGALPVQIINFEQLDKQGITSAEQLLRIVSANGNGADNMTSGNNVFGADADRVSGGASFASLRGLGPGSTLVLLNGRRLASHGASGKAVDLNAIPMAAIARVEILKDGASAIYGTDAIGGVINFILKSDYQGVELSGATNFTEHGGGATRRATLLAGRGDLDSDRYNLMLSLTLDRDDKLSSRQRGFANGYQPARGLSPDTTGTPYANQLSGAGTALGSGFTPPGDSRAYLQANLLSFQGRCDSVAGMSPYQTALWKDVTSPLRTTYSCAYDYGADYVISFPVERSNAVARAAFQLDPRHRLTVEALASRAKATAELTPMQLSATLANGGAYPVGGPYYQDLTPYIASYDRGKPIAYKWRAGEFGNRTQQNVSDNTRLLLGADGSVGRWDYKAGLSRAESRTRTALLDGYAYADALYAALGGGKINPWLAPGQRQSAEALALIEASKFRGDFQRGTTTMTEFDGSFSGELLTLPAGPLSMALGLDLRREGYRFGQEVDAATIWQAPGNAALAQATRDVRAVYAELLVPVFKDLEWQLALRRDHYSVFGATTNPKLAFRYQPAPFLLLRGSASKGFLAPSFQQLYAGTLLQELPNGVTDPLGCPLHPADPAYCAIARLPYVSGGNMKLSPETAKQGGLGVVFEPVKGYSASIDYWAINSKDRILNRTPQVVLQNYQALERYIVRNPDGTIAYVQAGWINAAGSKTRGADIGLRGAGRVAGYRWNAALDGTYLNSFKFAEYEGQPYEEKVGRFYTRDLYLRWKHHATVSVARGDWSALLAQQYASGYTDQLPNAGKGTPPPGFDPRVGSYTTYSLSASYKGIARTEITLGIQNLFDTDPPFTAHNVDEVVGAGWDPRVADPRGRALSLLLRYTFM